MDDDSRRYVQTFLGQTTGGNSINLWFWIQSGTLQTILQWFNGVFFFATEVIDLRVLCSLLYERSIEKLDVTRYAWQNSIWLINIKILLHKSHRILDLQSYRLLDKKSFLLSAKIHSFVLKIWIHWLIIFYYFLLYHSLVDLKLSI